MREAQYKVIGDYPSRLVIKDLGPWEEHLTVTNDAEGVVKRVFPQLGERRLFCIDSSGESHELVVNDDGGFFGFGGDCQCGHPEDCKCSRCVGADCCDCCDCSRCMPG